MVQVLVGVAQRKQGPRICFRMFAVEGDNKPYPVDGTLYCLSSISMMFSNSAAN